MSTPQPSEEELRAAYEEEIKRVRVEHILLDNVVTLINLGMRRTGLQPGTEDERDVAQVRLAIESVRALLPLIESVAPEQLNPIKQALSQMQLAFVRIGGAPAPGEDPGTPAAEPAAQQPPAEQTPPKPGEPGPAQKSGRLWIPGQ